MTYPTIKPHKHAEVLRAIADGKEVQFYDNGYWHDFDCSYHLSPMIIGSVGYLREWRIKPDTKPDYVVKAKVNCDKDFGDYSHGWQFFINVTIDGETDLPKSVEIIE